MKKQRNFISVIIIITIIGIMAARGVNRQNNVETLATPSAIETLDAQHAVTMTQAQETIATQTATPCPSTKVNADETVMGPAVVTVEYNNNVISASVPDGIYVDFNEDGWVNYCNYEVSLISLHAMYETGMISISVHKPKP